MDDNLNDSPPPESKPLEYEETPILEPVNEETAQPQVDAQDQNNPPPPEQNFRPEFPKEAPSAAYKPPGNKPSILKMIGSLFLFIILFAAGIGIAMFLRQYLPSSGKTGKPTTTITPTASPSGTPASPGGASEYPDWLTYQVTNGLTRQPISGVTFMLPPDVAAPICDGGSCASQGTYLPGGTRFTVAPRGQGQVLLDPRGHIVSDLAGQAFTVKDASVSGKPAVEFSGLFTGTTNGGYAFNQMHGFMIYVTDTLTLEINHFTPSGVTADFAADDLLFGKIIGSLGFATVSSETGKGAVAPLPSPASASAASATSPGTANY